MVSQVSDGYLTHVRYGITGETDQTVLSRCYGAELSPREWKVVEVATDGLTRTRIAARDTGALPNTKLPNTNR